MTGSKYAYTFLVYTLIVVCRQGQISSLGKTPSSFILEKIMSIAQRIRGLFGQKLLQNTAGFKVIRESDSSSPWVSEGEKLALIPEGLQEVQFPIDIIGSDSIVAQVQVSVLFTYADEAESFFNFAYDVGTLSHQGNFADATKKAVINVIVPKVADALRAKEIADMVKETTFPATECDGVVIKSILLSVKPKDANVLTALGAEKTETLLRSANVARQQTRKQAVDQSAELRAKEHAQSMAAAAEAALLIVEQAKNSLASAESTAAAQTKLAEQQSQEASGMVVAFKGDPMAYALWKLANSGGDITVTTELLSALRGKV